jgi:hypothetical protein
MTDVNDTADEQRNLRTLKTIVGIGLAALAVSIASGDRSRTEGAFHV